MFPQCCQSLLTVVTAAYTLIGDLFWIFSHKNNFHDFFYIPACSSVDFDSLFTSGNEVAQSQIPSHHPSHRNNSALLRWPCRTGHQCNNRLDALRRFSSSEFWLLHGFFHQNGILSSGSQMLLKVHIASNLGRHGLIVQKVS